jgi:hypothetical protein
MSFGAACLAVRVIRALSIRRGVTVTPNEEGGVTVIANTSPFNPHQLDRVKVTLGRHVSIDLEGAQALGRCGAGADMPRAIVIPAQGRACWMWLGPPKSAIASAQPAAAARGSGEVNSP